MTDIPTWKQKLEQQYINLAFDPAALSDLSKKEASYLKKKKDEVTIRSSAAEYLTYVASVGGQHVQYQPYFKTTDYTGGIFQ